ncbi:serine/threonine-protein phosphatase 5-related [Holotrichia oblita]|uniref:Serine/threonine-protein phosphatase 5-related n=1 Tax=Holotrichia oblita TaxID=644536 RepID=A0ACB9TAL8_HOLOL|nr:serine/threonine-protein phosphatase 5-related [Holotrichia oblita]
MESATQLGLPWRLLRDKLVALDSETGLVKYSTTFDKLNDSDIHVSIDFNIPKYCKTLKKLSLNQGFISLEEFSEACNLIREHIPNPLTQEQLLDICKLMDMNKDGFVDLNEFLETFRMVDPEQRGNEGKFSHDEFSAEQNLVNTFAQICTFADQTPKTSPTAKNCDINGICLSPAKKNGRLETLKKSSTNHSSSPCLSSAETVKATSITNSCNSLNKQIKRTPIKMQSMNDVTD